MHGVPEPQTSTKRTASPDENQVANLQSPRATKRRRGLQSLDEPTVSVSADFVHFSAINLCPRPEGSEADILGATSSSSGRSTPTSLSIDTDTTFPSQTPPTIPATPTSSGTPLRKPAPDQSYAGGVPDGPPSLNDSRHIVSVGGVHVVEGPFLLEAPTSTDLPDSLLTPPNPNGFVDPALKNLTGERARLMALPTAARPEDAQGKAAHFGTATTVIAPEASGRRETGPLNPLEDDELAESQYCPVDNEAYPVDCLLDKWGRDWFFVKWLDGTCSWEPRENIEDMELIRQLNAVHRGLRDGVEILSVRRVSNAVQYLVHWKGGKWPDQWLHERYMSRELIQKHRPDRKGRRGKRRS